MPEELEFRQRLQEIVGLVQDLENISDPASRNAAQKLMQLLMDLHGKALERSLEIIFGSPRSGSQLIDELGDDPLVGSVLVLYGLHPEDVRTRVERKLEQTRARFQKMGCEVRLVTIEDASVRVHVKLEGHACGSTTQSVRAAIEEVLYEAAPDLTSLSVEGLDPPTGGFIAVSQLLASSLPSPLAHNRGVGLSSDGMD